MPPIKPSRGITNPPVPVGGRLLIVEDNLVNQKVALRMLQKLGYRVTTTSNGVQALQGLERDSFDAVLMDCQMPEMDGFEATREIRRREGARRHTIIIAMTAGAMTGDREKCLEAGMDDYVTKPVRADELQRILQRYLKCEESPEKSQQRREDELEFSLALKNLEEEVGISVLRELIDDFITEGGALLETLRHQLNEKNTLQAARTLHTLRGCSTTLGARRLAEICGQLELAFRNNSLQEPSSALAEVAGAFQATIRELHDVYPADLEPTVSAQ